MAARRRSKGASTAGEQLVDVDDLATLVTVSIADLAGLLDPGLLREIIDHFGCAANDVPPKPGTLLEPRRVTPDIVTRLFTQSLVVAADIDPVRVAGQPPVVLWDTGADQLLVHLSESKVVLGDGFIDAFLFVDCNEAKGASVSVTFATASSKRPFGFVFATEGRPRGPAVVVDVWGEALIALAWRALVEAASVVAGNAGRDEVGRPYIAATVVATPDGLIVVPMVPHRFPNIGTPAGTRR
jgi:hypothetical protein